MGKIDIGKAFSRGWGIFSSNMVNLMVGFFLSAILSCTIILAPIMYAGLYYMLLKTARGQQAEIGDIFHGFSDFGRYFLGGLLLLGVSILGVFACFIGIFPAMGLILFVLPLMVDKGYGAGEALGHCWEYFKKDWLMAILLAFLTGFLSNAGSYVFLVGILFTGPFALAVTVGAYEHVFGPEANAAPAPMAAPSVSPE